MAVMQGFMGGGSTTPPPQKGLGNGQMGAGAIVVVRNQKEAKEALEEEKKIGKSKPSSPRLKDRAGKKEAKEATKEDGESDKEPEKKEDDKKPEDTKTEKSYSLEELKKMNFFTLKSVAMKRGYKGDIKKDKLIEFLMPTS